HKDHTKLSKENNRKEIENCGKIVEAFTGEKPTLFAPPSGAFNNDTLLVASELNYKVIMWSKDTIDWRDSDKDLIYKRATNNYKNGDLILMHPKKHTLEILPKIIDFYLEKGYNLVTVSENILGL
ncbi:MAG: polysaccharide deacetylase family protein, partial [Firmicutes bacterium]|nr:polysaccharide deacetylase family protein [Candidatus Caballimonas caccae]